MRCIVNAMAGVFVVAGLVSAALLAAPASGSDDQQVLDVYVHGLSLDGRVSVNGTAVTKYGRQHRAPLELLPDAPETTTPVGDFVDPLGDVFVENHGDLWSALITEGADRLAMRRDGRVRRNDLRLYDLPSTTSPWLEMISEFGRIYALRADGALAIDGEVIVRHPTASFHFRRVVRDEFNTYCLRTDGSVFRDDEPQIAFAFRAGSDGLLARTAWIAAALDPEVDPEVEHLYALRSDGVVKRVRLLDGGLFAESVATLPFDALAEPLGEQLYTDFGFSGDGTWYALAADGRVFSSADPALPLLTFPNDNPLTATVFTDLEILGRSRYGLRSDGRVYCDADPNPLCELPDAKHGCLALSGSAPTLRLGDTKHPHAARLTTRITAGTPLRLPAVVSDLDTRRGNLIVTPLTLPPGATWDGAAQALVWAAPGPPGQYPFRFSVTDGNRDRLVVYRVRVVPRDTDPNENARPLTPLVGMVQAVTGEELVLPLIVDDPDGDALQVTVNARRHPFTAGATFDPATGTFRWTPTADDCGTTVVRLRVTDGNSRPRTVRVRIRVKVGLFY